MKSSASLPLGLSVFEEIEPATTLDQAFADQLFSCPRLLRLPKDAAQFGKLV